MIISIYNKHTPVVRSISAPVHRLPRVRLLAMACLFVSLTLSVSVPARAANVPNFDVMVDLNVREQPVDTFISALFREIDVPLRIQSTMEGTVNGRFNKTAREVFEEVTNSFNIIVYYDGAVAHAYQANEVNRIVMPVSRTTSRRVIELANKLGLPDERHLLEPLNDSLIVTGTNRFVEQIKELSETSGQRVKKTTKKVAAPQPATAVDIDYPTLYRVFKLKHAWADDTTLTLGGQSVTVPGVATLLRSLVSGEPMAYQAASITRDAGSGPTDGLKGQGLRSARSANGATRDVGSQGLTVLSGAADIDSIRIVADNRLNAIVIRDTSDRMPAYRELIESLDVESTMIEIEATIIDINTDRSRELGINWRYQDDDVNILFGTGTNAIDGSLQGATVPGSQGRGGILSFMLGEPTNFLARVQLLEERGAARIVSKPHVITLSDVEAVLGATTEFFIRVAGQEEVDLFNVPVGTTLRVTPHVFSDGQGNRIKLLVSIEDGSSSNQQVDNIPVIERASISTQAVINEGDSLLVGGLVRDSYIKNDYRVPLLGSIPGLGRLFRSDRNSSTRVERLFMITPRLATGIGFDPTSHLPRLQGDSNGIIDDGDVRVERTEWPARDTPRLWPRERDSDERDRRESARQQSSGQTLLQRQNESLQRTPASAAQNSSRTGKGVDFVSPFTVEAWPGEAESASSVSTESPSSAMIKTRWSSSVMADDATKQVDALHTALKVNESQVAPIDADVQSNAPISFVYDGTTWVEE